MLLDIHGKGVLHIHDVLEVAPHLFHQLQGKLVVSRRHRRVGGKDALGPDRFNLLMADGGLAGFIRLLVQEFDGQEGRMPFVHVEAPQVPVAQGSEDANAADAQDDFLAQAVPVVAAIEVVGELLVPGTVFREIGVQEVYRHHKTADALDLIFPGPDLHFPALDGHRGPLRHLRQEIIDGPLHRLFGLVAQGVQPLVKIAFAVEQADGHHGHLEIGGRTDGVSGQGSQPAAVSGHAGLQGDLHGEIGDKAVVGHKISPSRWPGWAVFDRRNRWGGNLLR